MPRYGRCSFTGSASGKKVDSAASAIAYQRAANVSAGHRRRARHASAPSRTRASRLAQGADERIVAPVDDEGVGPEEEPQVVQIGRPPRHEVGPGSDVVPVRGGDHVRREEERPIEQPAPGERPEHAEEAPREGRARPRRRRAPIENPVGAEHERERDRDRLGEERQREEHPRERPPSADRRVEGAQVERRRQERGARREVVHRLRVERVGGHHERRRRADRHPGVAEPEAVPHDAEDEDCHQPVERGVDGVVAPRGRPRHGPVDREGDEQDGPQVLVLAEHARRVGVDEEPGDVGEAPDERVLRQGVPVVEVEAPTEAVRIGDAHHERQGDGDVAARASSVGGGAVHVGKGRL
jgi:hypothetical protein